MSIDAPTLAEAQQMLSIINAYMTEYVSGTRRKSLTLGSHEFMRAYNYVEIKWEQLVTERNRLQELITSLKPTGSVTPLFKVNTTFPLIVTRNPV